MIGQDLQGHAIHGMVSPRLVVLLQFGGSVPLESTTVVKEGLEGTMV